MLVSGGLASNREVRDLQFSEASFVKDPEVKTSGVLSDW